MLVCHTHKCFTFVEYEFSWWEARNYCHSLGFQLAKETILKDVNVAKEMKRKMCQPLKFWIGKMNKKGKHYRPKY